MFTRVVEGLAAAHRVSQAGSVARRGALRDECRLPAGDTAAYHAALHPLRLTGRNPFSPRESNASGPTSTGARQPRGLLLRIHQHPIVNDDNEIVLPVASHIRHQRRWDPEELTKIFPETLGGNLKMPPSIEFGQKIDERPADEWRDLGAGRRFWKSRYEEP